MIVTLRHDYIHLYRVKEFKFYLPNQMDIVGAAIGSPNYNLLFTIFASIIFADYTYLFAEK